MLPSDFSMRDFIEITLKTQDGVSLQAYHITKETTRNETETTLLFLHANAGNMGHRLPIAQVRKMN
jgi:hypothetical protein